MKKLIFICLLIFIGMNVFALERFQEGRFHPNVIVVAFDAEAINTRVGDINVDSNSRGLVQIGLQSFDVIANQYGFTNIERMFWVKDQEWHDENGVYPMNIFRVTVNDNSRMDDALFALSQDKNILFTEYEAINTFDYVPNDPDYHRQWHLPTIEAPEMWNFVRGDTTIVVGIVDDGMKWNHVDLRENIFINWAEKPGMTINWSTGVVSGGNNQDNDGNGYRDDVIGWEFVTSNNGTNQSYQGFDGNTHGTHVGGIVGAVGDNGIGVSGVAMFTRLLVSRHGSNTHQYGLQITNPYNGIYYAADTGARVINCSWSGPGGASTANTTVNYAFNKGAIVVASAGNNSYSLDVTNHYPAYATNAIAVSSSNRQDNKAGHSNWGSGVTISAPGDAIYSTYFSGSETNTSDTYSNATGTSMAAPVVSGVVAMILSTNPHLIPSDIKPRLINTADPMPDNEPGGAYAGLLGAGRINAFKAVMQDFIPNLSLIGDLIVEEYEGDGDGVPNIGEIISVKATILNEIGWDTARGVTATLTTDVEGVEIIQGVLEFNPNIFSGATSSSTNQALIRLDKSLNTLEIPFMLTIECNQEPSNAYPYTKQYPITVKVSMSKANWPLLTGGESPASPMVANLDGTGLRMITVVNGVFHVVDHKKNYSPGFPLNIGEAVNGEFAIGDVMRNSLQQIVVGTNSGKLLVISHNGEILNEFNAENAIRISPIIEDLNGDGHNEIIFATANGTLFVLNGNDLSVWQNFPVQIGSNITTNLAVGDINGDGIKNIVINLIANNGIHVINPMTGQNIDGFPLQMSALTLNGSTLANIGGGSGMDIIFAGTASANCPIVIVGRDGNILRQTTIPNAVRTEISIINLEIDGVLLLVFGDADGNIWVKNTMLEDLPGFPKKVAERIESSPVFADMDGDGIREIIFGDSDGFLHIIKLNGEYITGYPLKVNANQIRRSPWVGSFESGRGDILLAVTTGIDYIDTKRVARIPAWNTYRGNLGKTASASDPRTPDTDIIVPILKNSLAQNFPNPFNPITNISFSLEKEENVRLSIFNIRGQLVKTLLDENMTPGQHNVIWTGTDDNDNKVSSGLYLYRIETNSFNAVKRMTLLK